MAAFQQPVNKCIPYWEDGWKKSCEALHPDDKSSFLSLQGKSSECLDDVLKEARIKRDLAISKRWKIKKASGSTVILRDVFEKILNWVSRFTQVVDILANADPVHAGLPWGACRFLLQVSTSDIQAFGSLSEGIELVAGVAFRYRILENICSSAMPASRGDAWLFLRECIIKVYTAILKYLANAIKYWSHNTAARMLRSLFQDMDAEQQRLQLEISKIDEEAFKITNLFQYQDLFNISRETQEALHDAVDQLRGPISRLAQDVSDIKDGLQENERMEFFRWLSSVPCEFHHQESCKKILEGTGKWLLENAHFLEWQRSSASAIFWLNGNPGCGKSKLTSIVIKALLERRLQADARGAPLAYFYCSQKSTDPRTANTGEILRSVLRQLTGCDTRLALRGRAGQEFRQRKEQAKYKGAQTLPLDIQETVAQILTITNEDPVTIVLDALDEVDDTKRVDLLDALEQIVRESHSVVKIFISSRRDRDIVERFEQYTEIRVDHSVTHHDIHRFVEHKVGEAITTKKLLRGKVSLDLRNDILETLSKGANGMFRWVELSIDMLSNPKRFSVEKDVRSKLGHLPETLEQQYAIIYQEIIESEPSTASIARRTFSWILAAQRALSVKEFIAAVALDNDGYYHTDLDVSSVLDICRNLIVVVSTDGKYAKQSFQVAHFSVKEYLSNISEFSPERVHATAMLRCLQTFGPKSIVDKQFVSKGEEIADDMRNYAIYLFKHAGLSDLRRPSSSLASIMKLFLFDERLERTPVLQQWTDRLKDLVENPILPINFEDEKFRNSHSFLDFERVYDNNGICFVSRHGLLGILELLEVECDLLRMISSKEIHSSPLYTAVESGNYAVAQWLLDRNFSDLDENYQNHTYGWSLCRAVSHRESYFVNLLLKHGADPLALGHRGYEWTAWHGGCCQANLDIFRSLLLTIERKCGEKPQYYKRLEFNWKSEALSHVFTLNWTEGIMMLMNNGADIFSPIWIKKRFSDERQMSSLQIATMRSNYSTIEMVLKVARQRSQEIDKHKKATTVFQTWVDSLDGWGRSALHCVKEREIGIYNENESIMKLLLSHGADPKIRDLNGATAIHVAASIGSSTMVRTLQKMGVAIGARANNGATALHAAAGWKKSVPSVIRVLIEDGLDPLEADYEGRTSLHYAAMWCNASILKAICEVLTQIDRLVRLPVDGPAATPGFASHANVVDRLSFTQRAMFNSTDLGGNTPFHVVGYELGVFAVNSQERREEVSQIEDTIRLLLEHGADINIRNSTGQTPVLRLVASFNDCMPRPISKEVIPALLLCQGADCDISDSAGLTPLHWAASHWRGPVEGLIRAGANIEARDHIMRTPLHLSSRSNYEEGTMRLLQQGANPEVRDLNQATPLHYAAQNRNIFHASSIVSLLVEAEADVNAVDNSGSTALHWAAKIGNAKIIQSFLDAGADPCIINGQGANAMQITAREASIFNTDFDELDKGTWISFFRIDFLRAWYLLYKASNHQSTEIGLGNATHRLQRSQSLILRTDQTWGDFSNVRAAEIARR